VSGITFGLKIKVNDSENGIGIVLKNY